LLNSIFGSNINFSVLIIFFITNHKKDIMMNLKIVDMIEITGNPAFNKEFPDFITRQLDSSPEIVLDLLIYYMKIPTEDRYRENISLR
ncbi:MAG: hypothetical protein ACKVOA_06755, partial [Methylophilaceae bacterium]